MLLVMVTGYLQEVGAGKPLIGGTPVLQQKSRPKALLGPLILGAPICFLLSSLGQEIKKAKIK